jgi:hypothetical protein
MKTWTFTALSAEFDFPYRTLMRWRKPPLSISPSVRIPGKAKAEFSKADVALFLTARRAFAADLLAPEVKGLLNFLREYEIMEAIFSDDAKVATWGRNKLDDGSTLLVMPLRDPTLRKQTNEYIKNHEYIPMGKDDPVIIASGAIGAEQFQKNINVLVSAQWQFALIDLASIVREFDGRLDAIAHNRDYKQTIAAGNQALAAALVEHANKN